MNAPHASTLHQALPTTAHSLWGGEHTLVNKGACRHEQTCRHTNTCKHTHLQIMRYGAKKGRKRVREGLLHSKSLSVPLHLHSHASPSTTFKRVCVRLCVRLLVCKALERVNSPSSVSLLTRCWMKSSLRRKGINVLKELNVLIFE